MKRHWAKFLIGVIFAGYFFWAYNAANNVDGLYMEGPFVFLGDCQSARLWVQSMQPSPTPTPVGSPTPGPSPNLGLIVSPSCYLMNGGN
jgi:hypothetical protein